MIQLWNSASFCLFAVVFVVVVVIVVVVVSRCCFQTINIAALEY